MPGKIVVRLLLEDEYTKHIIVPAQYQKVKILGEVIALGGDEPLGDEEYPLAKGDIVCFSPSSGVNVTVGRDSVLVLKVTEILARVSWPSQ